MNTSKDYAGINHSVAWVMISMTWESKIWCMILVISRCNNFGNCNLAITIGSISFNTWLLSDLY